MINMPLKGPHIKKKCNFEHDLTWFSTCCFAFLPSSMREPKPGSQVSN